MFMIFFFNQFFSFKLMGLAHGGTLGFEKGRVGLYSPKL